MSRIQKTKAGAHLTGLINAHQSIRKKHHKKSYNRTEPIKRNAQKKAGML